MSVCRYIARWVGFIKIWLSLKLKLRSFTKASIIRNYSIISMLFTDSFEIIETRFVQSNIE